MARRQTEVQPPEEADLLVRLRPNGGIVAPVRGIRMEADRGSELPNSELLSPGQRLPPSGLLFPAPAGQTPWSAGRFGYWISMPRNRIAVRV